jgi:hypothetical protein
MKRGSSATIPGFGGTPGPVSAAPFFTNAGMKNGEDAMITEKDLVPILHGAPHLQEILTASGFTPADLEALVDSELETSDLLRYIDALLSNRMN